MATSLPEKFLGKFKHERSEKFDEYLSSQGVNWLLRKLICFSSITKTFEKSPSAEGRYDAHNFTSKGDTAYLGWALGDQFEAKGFDGKQHKIKFALEENGDTLTEEHIRLEDQQGQGADQPAAAEASEQRQPEVYRYAINEEDKLVLTLTNKEVTARRFFKRMPE